MRLLAGHRSFTPAMLRASKVVGFAVFVGTEHRSQIKMQRWIATILLVVVLTPSFGPMALAYSAQPGAMHCLRKPVQGPAAMQPTMQCHHGAASPQPSSSETSFSSLDSCCGNHDCCRGLRTSEWARPTFNPLSLSNPAKKVVRPSQPVARISADVADKQSARAPPHS